MSKVFLNYVFFLDVYIFHIEVCKKALVRVGFSCGFFSGEGFSAEQFATACFKNSG
jgi:hypothetical protein